MIDRRQYNRRCQFKVALTIREISAAPNVFLTEEKRNDVWQKIGGCNGAILNIRRCYYIHAVVVV